MVALASSASAAHGAGAGTRWHLTIPIAGTYQVPSGEIYAPPTAVATFGDALADVNYLKLTYLDVSTNQRNYDSNGLLHTASNLDRNTYTSVIGAGQIGRYTDGYPQSMTFYEAFDFGTMAESFSTPGNGSVTVHSTSQLAFDSTKTLYARVWFNRGDGNAGPLCSNIQILADVTCPLMPGAHITGYSQNIINWTVSPANEAVAQKLYRATSMAGPFTLLHSFSDNTTATFTDTTATPGNTYYYKVVAESTGGLAGADSNVITVPIVSNLVVTGMTPLPNSSNLTSLPNIVINFNKNVSAATVNPNSIVLVRAGTDKIFDTADDVTITIPAGNITLSAPTQITISLSGLNLPADTYRVSLIGSVAGTSSSSDAIVTVPGYGLSVPTGDFTVEFWQFFTGGEFHLPTTFNLNPQNASNRFEIHTPWNSGPDYLFWEFAADNHNVTNIGDRGVWSHFALVKSGTSIQVFWNGNLIISDTQNSNFVPYQSDLELPGHGGGQPFLGYLDEFRIWNVARSQTQIKTYMKRSLTGTESGLQAYWDFNEGQGTAAADKTGHGFNGTMASPPVWNVSTVPLLPAITDQNNSVLDGEFSGTFPSGNGFPGGDFSAQFTLLSTFPPFKISAMTPAPGSVQTSVVNAVNLTLTSSLDPATLNNNSVVVQSAGPDGVIDTADDVTLVPSTLSVVNGTQLNIGLPAQTNAHETYRVTLNGTTLPTVKNSIGSNLDGEFTGTFPTGDSNFGGDFTTTFQVNLQSTTLTATAPAAIAYGITTTPLSAAVTSGGAPINSGTISFQLVNGVTNVGSAVTSTTVANGTASVTYALPSGTPVGNYTLVATYSGSGSLTGSVDSSKQLTITQTALTITGDTLSRQYGAANPVLTATIAGLKYGDAITAAGVTSATLNSDVGAYTLVPTISDPNTRLPNYTVTINNGTLNVTQAPLSVIADNLSRVYGADNPVLTGTLSGNLAADGIGATYATNATVSSSIGMYDNTPTLLDPNNRLANYLVSSQSAVLTVSKAPLNVFAFNATRLYGAANPVFSGMVSGVVNGDTIFAVYNTQATSQTGVGNYAIVPTLVDPDSKLANYSIGSSSGALTITAAPLTITTDNLSRPYGVDNPVLTGSIVGIQNNDPITATFATDATSASLVGLYTIVFTIHDEASKIGNYVLTTSTGILAVTAVAPTITAALSASGTQGVPFTYAISASGSPTLNYSASGLPAGLTLTDTVISGIPAATGIFNVQLSVSNDAGGDSRVLKLTLLRASGEDRPPVFSSPPSATPNAGTTGSPITFISTATDADGDALDYTWDFGDGTTGDGSTVTKTYPAPGVYVVKVTVSDGQASDTQSVNVVVNQQTSSAQLTIQKLTVEFNFLKTAADGLTLSGQIPASATFNPAGKTVRILIGDLDKSYTLTARGASADRTFHLTGKSKNGAIGFTYALKKQSLFPLLEPLGFTKTTNNAALPLPIVIALDGASYFDSLVIGYKVKSKRNVPASGLGRK